MVTTDIYFNESETYKNCALWQLLHNCTWAQAQLAVIGAVIFDGE